MRGAVCVGGGSRPGLLDAVGEDALARIQDAYLNYLESSAAIFEPDGTCACIECRSQYCGLLRRASRQLVQRPMGAAAPPALCCRGGWLAAREAIARREPAFGECAGGLTVCAAPILACGRVIGANVAVVSAPPQDGGRQQAVAEKFELPLALVRAAADAYAQRPLCVIDAARRHIESAASAIGELYATRCHGARNAPQSAMWLAPTVSAEPSTPWR